MTAPSTPAAPTDSSVRTRRAYFDCQFGQLHVRTAFPATGGFDEQVTLICVHPSTGAGASRVFSTFLPGIADRRCVYAPDLPGYGESDPATATGVGAGTAAILDLAAQLRLRRIDVLGLRDGCLVAMELALAKPELVRRLVLTEAPASARGQLVEQPCLVLAIGAEAREAGERGKPLPPNAQRIDVAERSADPFGAAAPALVRQCAQFLDRKRL